MTSMSPPPAVMTDNRPCAVPIMNITLWRSPVIGAFLDRPRKMVWLPWGQAAASDWLGWGRKPSARRAAWYAGWRFCHHRATGLPALAAFSG